MAEEAERAWVAAGAVPVPACPLVPPAVELEGLVRACLPVLLVARVGLAPACLRALRGAGECSARLAVPACSALAVVKE